MTEDERKKAYQAEVGPLIEEYRRKSEDCMERHKNDDTPRGLDCGPGSEERDAINREFCAKLREIRRKYGYISKE
jgi:hypothetical protein